MVIGIVASSSSWHIGIGVVSGGSQGTGLEQCRSRASGPPGAGEVSDLIDTSLIVRYLTGEPPHLADLSARLIDGDTNLTITSVVLVELAYVRRSVYGVPRERVVDQLAALLRRANIGYLPDAEGADDRGTPVVPSVGTGVVWRRHDMGRCTVHWTGHIHPRRTVSRSRDNPTPAHAGYRPITSPSGCRRMGAPAQVCNTATGRLRFGRRCGCRTRSGAGPGRRRPRRPR